MLNPISDNQAYATYTVAGGDGEEGNNETSTDPDTAIKIDLTGTIQSSVIASVDAVSYITNTFTVSATNAKGGYHVSVQAAEGHNSNLVGRTTYEPLTGVGDKVEVRAFKDDTWGYALTDQLETVNENLTYSTLPDHGAASTPPFISDQPNETKNFKIVFAAKFGNSKPSDHYENQVLISAVTGASAVAGGFRNILSMQEMTSELCKETPIGYTKQLQDTRDDKWYWVAKLADGNCWMTQNLDYNAPEISRISTPKGWTESAVKTSTAAYYDAGLYVLTNPTLSKTCNTETGLDTSGCEAAGWKDVSGWTPMTEPSDVIIDEANKLYDAHYSVGNYYSWLAATNKDAAGGNNVQGVCPDNWKLPINDTMDSGSFAGLLHQYGLATDKDTGTLTGTGPDHITYSIYSSPLYFLRGGHLNTNSSNWSVIGLNYAGSYGCYWTSTPVFYNGSDTYSYTLLFNGTDVFPSNYNGTTNYHYNNGHRSYGNSVRCLAQ